MADGVLILEESEEGSDYTLREDARSVWIEVGGISVYILREHGGVKVELLARDHEGEDPPLATATADEDDLEEWLQERERQVQAHIGEDEEEE